MPIRALITLPVVLVCGFAGEWILYDFVGEQAGERGMIGFLILAAIVLGLLAAREAAGSRVTGGTFGAIFAGLVAFLNFYFIQWLWIEPRGRLSIGEFGWSIPLYVTVLGPASALLAFVVAFLATSQRLSTD